jgi:GTP-binding protein HflX
LLHVVDAGSNDIEEHIAVVNETLKEMAVSEKPVILVFNKIDLVSKENRDRLNEIAHHYSRSVFVSAERGYGIASLKEEISALLTESSSELEVEVPMDHYEIASRLHELAEVTERTYTDRSVLLKLLVHRRNLARVERLLAMAA